MNNDTQIVKGILEGCILKIIEAGEIYGYRAVELLNDMGFDVTEATVYPILARLEIKGYLHVEKRPSPLGPMRKYYTLTRSGIEALAEFKDTWNRIGAIVNNVLEGKKNDQ